MPEISAAVSPFARSATRKPASCAGLASAEKTWSIAQAASSSAMSCPPISRPSTAGHVGGALPRVHRLSRGPGRPVRASRSTWATTSAVSSGSSGCTSTASACDHVPSQRSSRRRTVRISGGQFVDDLVAELAGQPHAAGGLRLPVQDREVDLARVARGQHLGHPARLTERHPAHVRRRPPADRVDDRLTDLGAVAVDQDRRRRRTSPVPAAADLPCRATGHTCARHGADTSRPDRPGTPAPRRPSTAVTRDAAPPSTDRDLPRGIPTGCRSSRGVIMPR